MTDPGETDASAREPVRRPNFDLADCALLLNVAQARSLTRGAERTSLSTPAASMRIKSLEETFGLRLIDRRREGATLTPAGEAFRHHAAEILRQVARLDAELAEMKRARSGHMTILASPMLAHEVLPSMIERFLLERPEISIDLREEQSAVIADMVRGGEAEIGVISGEYSNLAGLELFPFLDESMVLVVPAGDGLAAAQLVAFADIAGRDFVALSTDSALHKFLRRLRGSPYPEPHIRASVGTYDAMARLVGAGVGIGAMPEATAHHLANFYDVAIVRLADEWARRKLVLCVRSTADMPAHVEDVVGWLRRIAAPPV